MVAKPKPMIVPPSICPWWLSGLMIVPTSWVVTMRCTRTWPVSGPTATSAACAVKQVTSTWSLL